MMAEQVRDLMKNFQSVSWAKHILLVVGYRIYLSSVAAEPIHNHFEREMGQGRNDLRLSYHLISFPSAKKG